jgi:hypothetical protein
LEILFTCVLTINDTGGCIVDVGVKGQNTTHYLRPCSRQQPKQILI